LISSNTSYQFISKLKACKVLRGDKMKCAGKRGTAKGEVKEKTNYLPGS
jgi:hypothetical protein